MNIIAACASREGATDLFDVKNLGATRVSSTSSSATNAAGAMKFSNWLVRLRAVMTAELLAGVAVGTASRAAAGLLCIKGIERIYRPAQDFNFIIRPCQSGL